MQQTTVRGLAWTLAIITLVFSAAIVLRVSSPSADWSISQTIDSEQTLQYALPFIGSSIGQSNIDPFAAKESARLKLLNFVKTFFAVNLRRESFSNDYVSPMESRKPIWLINCAMLC